MGYVIFLSHATVDKPLVEPITKKLSEVFNQENMSCRDFKLCIRLLLVLFDIFTLRYHQQILYIVTFDCCILCWYCKDHIHRLYEDHISFQLKWHKLQLHNWIDLVLSILCLLTVKQPGNLQLGQLQYDDTFIRWSALNWTILPFFPAIF